MSEFIYKLEQTPAGLFRVVNEDGRILVLFTKEEARQIHLQYGELFPCEDDSCSCVRNTENACEWYEMGEKH